MSKLLQFIGRHNNLQYYAIGKLQDSGDTSKVLYSTAISENFMQQGCFEIIDSGQAGVFIRNVDADGLTYDKHQGYTLFYDKVTSTIRLVTRNNEGDSFIVLAEVPNKTLPVWLKVEKVGNTFNAYYSSNAANTQVVTWTNIYTKQNAFAGWTNARKGLVGASLSENQESKVVVTSTDDYINVLGANYAKNFFATSVDLIDDTLTVQFNPSSNVNRLRYQILYSESLISVMSDVVDVPTNKTLLISNMTSIPNGFYTIVFESLDRIGYETVGFEKTTDVATPTLKLTFNTEGNTTAGVITLTNYDKDSTVVFYRNGEEVSRGLVLDIVETDPNVVYTAKQYKKGVFSGISNTITVNSNTQPPAVPALVITASPTPIVEGVSVVLTAQSPIGTVHWFKNGIEVLTGNTLSIGNPTLNDVYTAKQVYQGVTSGNSNSLTVVSNNNQQVYFATFTNAFADVPVETATGVFSPHKFPNVVIPTEYNARIDNLLPNYVVMINNDSLNQFALNGTTPFQKGIYSWRNNAFQHCVDFWDNCSGVSNENFVTARPYNERYDLFLMGDFNVDGLGADDYFRTKTIEQCYNLGLSFGGPFGLGDSPDGFRTRRFAHESDVEIGLVSGDEEEASKKLAAYYAGIADKSLGIVLAQYMCALFTFGSTAEGRYPDANGNYPSRRFPRDNDTNGLTWGIPFYFWNSFPLNGQNKYLSDYENLFLVEETSHPTEDSWKQNKQVLSTSGAYLRTVNHFGLNYDLTGENGYNVNHVVGRAVSLIETDVYINKHLRGKETIQMFKIVCDGNAGDGGVWKWLDTQEFASYGNRSVLALPREIGFMVMILQFMSGSKGNLFWGSPQNDTPADGYNAVFAGNALLNKPVQLNGQTVSLAGLRNNLTFLQWNSEQSYDGGNTWVKHKAMHWKNSKNYLPLRLAYDSNGHIVVFACRPYDVEPTTIKYRIQTSSFTYVGEITTGDWQSCYPVEEPNRKDYHVKLIKI